MLELKEQADKKKHTKHLVFANGIVCRISCGGSCFSRCTNKLLYDHLRGKYLFHAQSVSANSCPPGRQLAFCTTHASKVKDRPASAEAVTLCSSAAGRRATEGRPRTQEVGNNFHQTSQTKVGC